jgi:NAD(P)-dependent dehydrogenase (short-subunit alcohol dehydrogenase family)
VDGLPYEESEMNVTSPFDLTGKVAVVTGSSRGIGRAIVELMARFGAKVVVSSRKIQACEVVAAGIRESGGEAIAIPCNISVRADVERLADESLAHWGRIDVIVCNAAVNPAFGPLSNLADETFDKILDGNVKSNLWLCNKAIPAMAERGGGSVIFVSSIAGLRGSAVIGAYGISKAADFALARNLAVEWGARNVRVNCIAPGLIKTDFARALWEDKTMLARREAATPLGRIGLPEEIAPAAVYLASDASRFMTGQIMVIDGGVTIGS